MVAVIVVVAATATADRNECHIYTINNIIKE